LSQFKKYHPSENLKFYKLGILKSLKFGILVKKILPISLKLNFTPNTLGCKGLTKEEENATSKIFVERRLYRIKGLVSTNFEINDWFKLGQSIISAPCVPLSTAMFFCFFMVFIANEFLSPVINNNTV